MLAPPKWKVKWSVTLAGQDLTSAWAPTLIDISVTDKAGEASDSCDLTIDDSDGRVRMPSKRMPILVTSRFSQLLNSKKNSRAVDGRYSRKEPSTDSRKKESGSGTL